jgi:hypothetical protein
MNSKLFTRKKVHSIIVLLSLHSAMIYAGAIRNLPGFTTTYYGPNDDGTYPVTGSDAGIPDGTPTTVPIGFSVNFYGQTFSNLYLNNNGNVTFDAPLGTFTPFGLVGTARQIIAPFFADVDTRGMGVVTFGNDVVDGRPAFGVNWTNVGYFDAKADKLNSFQLVLINRSDRNAGDFDIEFNYDQVQWETGDASDGTDGLDGSSAVAGFSNGSKRPGTSFQLSGSGVPRSFLDVNPAGLIHNFLNTNVPGRYIIPIVNLTNTVLNVQRFAQNDPAWGANAYANSSRTIEQQGSELACLAMALHFQGVATDPGQLNTLLKADGDFDGAGINWGPATRDASNRTLEFHAHRASDTQYLSQILSLGFPVIVQVSNLEEGDHYVLVIGEKNGQFLINDPGRADATTLDAFDNEFETRGYVSDPPGDVSEFDISAGDTTEVLVVDPLGRRTGYDPALGTVVEGIPQSVHFLDTVENSDVTGEPGTNAAHIVDIYQPLPGNYQIYLYSVKNGDYQAPLRAFLPNGSAGTSVTFQGTKTAYALTSFQVNFGPGGLTSQTFTNGYVWTASPTNGSLPLFVQFTAPNTDTAGHTITNWFWDLGIGSFSTDQNPGATYTNAGIFYPSVIAIDDTGSTIVSYGTSIIIPTVAYTANPTNGPGPSLTVQFNAANVDISGNPVGGWNWDFGDGSFDTGQNPSHTYTSYGTFVANLTATNSLGAQVYGVGPAITSLPTEIQNSGFETGFGTEDIPSWTRVGDRFGTFIDDGSTAGISPHSGSYLAFLGTFGSPGSLSQSIVTAPGRPYLISFWLNGPDGFTPNEFLVKWNGKTIFDQTDLPAFDWTNLQFTVTGTGTSGTLQFGYQDDPGFLAIDDVSVTALPVTPPTLSILRSGQNIVVTWPTNAAIFTLRSTTNLISPNWITNTGVTVFGGQNAVTNPISGRQIFYQLIQ